MSHPVYGLNELREMFLRFFESKGHLRLPSFSLIPQNDKSILLINAGMTPMKPWFKGEEEPPRRRVCTCQKCIRTGDIEKPPPRAATAPSRTPRRRYSATGRPSHPSRASSATRSAPAVRSRPGLPSR